jgi:Kdo2-lipid IVA lauroyltransferase/acyltransferase
VSKKRSAFRNWLEYIPAYLLLKFLGALPRKAAISIGKRTAHLLYRLNKKLRFVGHRNLEMAMPNLNGAEREAILKGVCDNLGRLLGEFSQFPKITKANLSNLVVYDGFENYGQAAAKGNGVLLLTGHIGAWELCAFAQGMYGYPLSFLVRPLDNPLLDILISRYRQLSGNGIINKNKSVKDVLTKLRRGNDVGLLIDINTLPDQGVFCDFFGLPACSTTGLAVFALRSEAPVVPGFLIWDEKLAKHVLRFEPEIALIRTGDFKEEVQLNTARFMQAIEACVRRYPEQWLWIHRRWRTRPEGNPDLYK